MNNNQRLKLICTALRLNRRDVARAVTLGGIETSASRADAWLRAENHARARAGHDSGLPQWRDREITEHEFDAFLTGLRPMLDEVEAQERNG